MSAARCSGAVGTGDHPGAWRRTAAGRSGALLRHQNQRSFPTSNCRSEALSRPAGRLLGSPAHPQEKADTARFAVPAAAAGGIQKSPIPSARALEQCSAWATTIHAPVRSVRRANALAIIDAAADRRSLSRTTKSNGPCTAGCPPRGDDGGLGRLASGREAASPAPRHLPSGSTSELVYHRSQCCWVNRDFLILTLGALFYAPRRLIAFWTVGLVATFTVV